MKSWGEIGKEVVNRLEQLELNHQGRSIPVADLESLANKALSQINKRCSTDGEKANALKQINRPILDKYPRLQEKALNHFYDPTGKDHLPKYRHNIFAFLSLKSSQQRTEIFAQIQADAQSSPATPEPPKQEESEIQVDPLTAQSKSSLDTMTLSSLGLDAETLQFVETAMQHSGMTLPEITRKALTYYAKSLAGKARKHGEDLSGVSTEELLNADRWSNHPQRGRELARRTVRAIKSYNAQQPELKDRWVITTSLVSEITGSREAIVKPVLDELSTDIADHHLNYGLLREDGTPNIYINRKRGVDIKATINLSELVPDGLE